MKKENRFLRIIQNWWGLFTIGVLTIVFNLVILYYGIYLISVTLLG